MRCPHHYDKEVPEDCKFCWEYDSGMDECRKMNDVMKASPGRTRYGGYW